MGVTVGAFHQADEHRPICGHERRDTPYRVLRRGDLVFAAHHLQGPAVVDVGEDRSNVTTMTLQHSGERVAVPQISTVIVPKDEQVAMDVTEADGIEVAHRDTNLQRQQAAVVIWAVPDRWFALIHVHLCQRERDEGDVPISATGQSVQHVLNGVAGEGAAVVPGYGKGSHGTYNAGPTAGIPYVARVGLLPLW